MKNQEKRMEILKWASGQPVSAHETFDALNDRDAAIKCFFSEECPKDESGMVLSVEDAQVLAYAYARRLLELKGVS